MTELELQTYIENYTAADFYRIKLVWNGKYGPVFVDDNYEFRIQVCEYVVPLIDKVNMYSFVTYIVRQEKLHQ